MAAYFIAQYVVNDPKLYREYQAGAGPTIQACRRRGGGVRRRRGDHRGHAARTADGDRQVRIRGRQPKASGTDRPRTRPWSAL